MIQTSKGIVVTLFAASLSSVAVTAQTVPSKLPGNWTSQGCYTDVSTSRTLAAAVVFNDSMTIESCISFCDAANYIFAGAEFGNCDSTIQVPSQPAPMSDCNNACAGNSSEVCGGSGRLNLFYSGKPAPQIVQSVNGGQWTYEGCFTDNTQARTLMSPVNIPSGVTAASCSAACQVLGNFTNAGLEAGHECWCDNTIHGPTQRVSDNDCRMVCDVDHTQYCGNNNRVAIYHFTAAGTSGGPQPCLSTDISNFTLQATLKNPPESGPSTMALRPVVSEMVRGAEWTVLSACQTCCSDWPTFAMSSSVVFPKSKAVPGQLMSSTAPGDGESPNFVASVPAFPGFQAYCAMEDPVAPVGSPPLLAFGGKVDAFSLCKNQSADGRLDVVLSPVTGHPNYILSDCSPINIQVIQN